MNVTSYKHKKEGNGEEALEIWRGSFADNIYIDLLIGEISYVEVKR